VDSAWSLTSHPGKLALEALQAERFELARNTLSQKIMGFRGAYTVLLDLSGMADGQRAGLACMGKENHLLEVGQAAGHRTLSVPRADNGTAELPDALDAVWLRLTFDARDNAFQFAWSADGSQFSDLGDPFAAHFGFWKGARVALFSYNTLANAGTALFDDFTYRRDE
jgi:beta-xylosidase